MISTINKHRNRYKTWGNRCSRRWIIIEFTVYESWCYNNSFSLFSLNFSPIPPYRESFFLYNLILDHLDYTLVSHSSLYSSTCPIKYLPWLSVSCSGWNYTVQESSSHKCGQKNCCSALNAVITAFPLDISAFLSPSYTLWSFFLTLEVLRR